MVTAVCILTAVAVPAAFSDVEENFEPAGMVLGGSISFTYDFGYPFSGYSTNNTWMALDISPVFGMFILKNLSLQISPSFYFRQNRSDGNVSSQYAVIGLGAGAMYYLSSLEPLVPAFGAEIGFWYQPEGDYTSNFYWLGIKPQVYVYFFAADNVAPYAGLDTNFWLYFISGDVGVRTSVVLGIAVFLPNAVSPR